MSDTLDQTDREICAALLRNGRASWRRIARATGIQERTVARRGARLLDQQLVRVKALAQPHLVGRGEATFARIACRPGATPQVAQWLAHRDEALWVATVSDGTAVIAECYLRPEDRSAFIEEAVGELPVTDSSFLPIAHFHRTVRGWNPNILAYEQLEQLGENESQALTAADDPPPLDPTDRDIIALLEIDGRRSIETIAAELGLAKPTVRKRIDHMQRTDNVSIRAVLEPALLGFPNEVLVTARARQSALATLGERIAENWHARWVAEIPAASEVRATLTLGERTELRDVLREIDAHCEDALIELTAAPILHHTKRSDVVLTGA